MESNYYKGQGFWKEDPKNKRIDYPINDEIIKKAEGLLSVKFPHSFIEIMKVQNGGELNYPNFILPSGDKESYPYDEEVILPSIEPIHFEKDDMSLLSSLEFLNDEGLPKELIVLWTDFHFWVVLDYRNRRDNPPVMYIAENFASSNYNTKWEYIKVADTFDEFIKKLFN